MPNIKKFVIGGLVLIILLIALFISLFLKSKVVNDSFQNAQIQSNSLNTNTTADENSEPQISDGQYEYEFISKYKENGGDWYGENLDGKIVQTNLKTGQTTVLVESVLKAYPDPERGNGQTYSIISQSDKSPYLYLSNSYIEGMAGIIRFDRFTKKFTKLIIGDYFDIFLARASGSSPFAASTNNIKDSTDERSLFLLDLDNGTAKLLVKLPTNLTFNICGIEGGMVGNCSEIEWLDKENFEIKIFDAKPGPVNPETGGPEAILKETRKFNINQ